MIRTQVYIPDDLYKQAQVYARLSKTTISEFMREGLKLSIEKRKHKAKTSKKKSKGISSFAGVFYFGKGKTNAAATHNDIYDM